MLRLAAFAIAVTGAVAPAAADERTVPVTDFDRIVIEGPYAVQLVRDNVTRAVVTGPRRSLEAVSVEVQGRTLRIRRNPNNWGGHPGQGSGPPLVTVSGRELRSVRIVGAGSLDLNGARGMRLELSVEGSGRIAAADIAVDRLSAGVRGSGEIRLAGRAEVFTADVQGSGTLQAEALQVQDVTLTAATAGAIQLTADREATITANGLGSIAIAGTAACTIRGLNAANVACRNR